MNISVPVLMHISVSATTPYLAMMDKQSYVWLYTWMDEDFENILIHGWQPSDYLLKCHWHTGQAN